MRRYVIFLVWSDLAKICVSFYGQQTTVIPHQSDFVFDCLTTKTILETFVQTILITPLELTENHFHSGSRIYPEKTNETI